MKSPFRAGLGASLFENLLNRMIALCSAAFDLDTLGTVLAHMLTAKTSVHWESEEAMSQSKTLETT